MVQQPAEARSLGEVEAPQLSRDAVHEPFMFVLKTKILQDSPRRCLNLEKAVFWWHDLLIDIDRYRFWNPTKKNTGLFPSKKREIPM